MAAPPPPPPTPLAVAGEDEESMGSDEAGGASDEGLGGCSHPLLSPAVGARHVVGQQQSRAASGQ